MKKMILIGLVFMLLLTGCSTGNASVDEKFDELTGGKWSEWGNKGDTFAPVDEQSAVAPVILKVWTPTMGDPGQTAIDKCAEPTSSYTTYRDNQPEWEYDCVAVRAWVANNQNGAIVPVVDSCPQARDLGPWAPGSDGKGETFEVTASDQGASNLSSAGVVLGLWWPAGNTDWGTQEITTFVPRGMSVTVISAAGRGWDYEERCASAEVESQMNAHMDARKNDTSYHGFVPLEDLINAGLIEVRFDRR